jgi:hypothetical protein
MTSRDTVRPLVLPALGALLAWLALATDGYAQRGHQRPGGSEAQQAANQQMNFQEAEALREAYMLLSAANHDYNGHRGKAMAHLQEAVKLLDSKVLKHGTAGQKGATLQEDAAAARAKAVAKHAPGIREPQAQSDALLRKSGELIAQVVPALRQRNQRQVADHAVKAEKEIIEALKVR